MEETDIDFKKLEVIGRNYTSEEMVIKYYSLKSICDNRVVLIETEKYTYSYDKDAVLLSYLFNFNIKHDRVRFPNNKRLYICELLWRFNVSNVTYHENYFEGDEPLIDNQYYNLLDEAQRYFEDKNYINKLVSILIKQGNIKNNYQIIVEFLNTLKGN
ncbi:MAG: hypothetical protein RSB41_04630 [Bacilli bacterium]